MKYRKFLIVLLILFGACSKDEVTTGQLVASKLVLEIKQNGVAITSINADDRSGISFSGDAYTLTPDGFIAITQTSGKITRTYNLAFLRSYQINKNYLSLSF